LVADISNPDNNVGVGSDSEKTVLIVDSQPREAAALQKQLTFAGFKTEIATTGEGAVKILEARAPDIVLLDASLSDIDSGEVVVFIRSDLRTCRLPVVAMSVFPHMKGKCLQNGCDDFLQKPIQILDLVARIRRALR
jgi:DNA-binding response OmpR family regulator